MKTSNASAQTASPKVRKGVAAKTAALDAASDAADKPKTTRVQIELQDRAYGRLTALRDKTEAASYSEVIKNALRLYENMVLKTEEGSRVFLKGPDGEMVEYQIFL